MWCVHIYCQSRKLFTQQEVTFGDWSYVVLLLQLLLVPGLERHGDSEDDAVGILIAVEESPLLSSFEYIPTFSDFSDSRLSFRKSGRKDEFVISLDVSPLFLIEESRSWALSSMSDVVSFMKGSWSELLLSADSLSLGLLKEQSTKGGTL